eukprot:TRINITY_DN16005_c0_g1_i3.p2 TRINITY_DN16005_c0_g1~~TRINITY_DN16005_c0_g1_i3.p2  ORF type:complete len:113 (+),score=27.68 TRINITY_DN16005_c0_g1_i3:83-421(+)
METNDPKHQISIITSSSSSSPHPPISSTSNRNLNLNLNQGFDGVEKESSGDLALYGNVPQSAIPTPPPVPPRVSCYSVMINRSQIPDFPDLIVWGIWFGNVWFCRHCLCKEM